MGCFCCWYSTKQMFPNYVQAKHNDLLGFLSHHHFVDLLDFFIREIFYLKKKLHLASSFYSDSIVPHQVLLFLSEKKIINNYKANL